MAKAVDRELNYNMNKPDLEQIGKWASEVASKHQTRIGAPAVKNIKRTFVHIK